jgi:hypothetical protein
VGGLIPPPRAGLIPPPLEIEKGIVFIGLKQPTTDNQDVDVKGVFGPITFIKSGRGVSTPVTTTCPHCGEPIKITLER